MNKKWLTKKKGILIGVCSVVVIIVLAFAIFPIQIINFFVGLFNKPPVDHGADKTAIMFENVNDYIENPIALEGFSITPLNMADYNFVNNQSTSIEDAVAMFAFAETNLYNVRQWGVFVDIFAADTEVAMNNFTGLGEVATQFILIQDNDSFFRNEGFALISFNFTSVSSEDLNNLLINQINGGCRILTDTPAGKKYIQWCPQNGASYDRETKLISTALLPMSVKDIAEGVKDHEPYDKDKEFSLLLPLEVSANTIQAVTITYDAEAKVYTLVCTMSKEGMNSSDKAISTIRNLFGEDIGKNMNVSFNSCTFTIEIWQNGLFKSISGDQNWGADFVVQLGPLKPKLTALSPSTKANLYFTYSDEDCLVPNIKEKYYKDLIVED